MAETVIPGPAPILITWWEILRTGNVRADAHLDLISRWLLITRACVFSMTLTSACIGGLLAAASAPAPDWSYFALAVIGLLLAHASNNMMNDYFDLSAGLDTVDSLRALYAPHPVLGGLITKSGLRIAILAVLALGGVVAIALVAVRGLPVAAFTLAGLLFSVFYVAPPIKLKHHGLGEPTVFIVWGPLMIGGTYYVTAGTLPPWVWLASLPYALIVMTVLIGKHIDKYDMDTRHGVRTLPVILGTRASRALNQSLMVGFYMITVAVVALSPIGLGPLLVVFGIPRLVRVLQAYGKPKPTAPPPGYRVWPLWYVAIAFYHNRLAGGLFVLGLAVDLLFGT